MENLTKEQAYDKMEEVLLPVFKEAVELCKYLNNDQDFFKKGYNQVKLLSMALVSLAIKEVNTNSGTIDEKKEALHDMGYWDSYFIKDGQRQKVGHYHHWKGVREVLDYHAFNIPCDDNYEIRYLGAFQRDVHWWSRKESLISTSGDILDWSKMQDSHVFEAVSRVDYLNYTKEDNAKRLEKIKEFCDLQKNKRDKSFENKKEQIKMRLHEREQCGADDKVSGVIVNEALVRMHDDIGTVTPDKAKILSPIIKEAILEKRKNKK